MAGRKFEHTIEYVDTLPGMGKTEGAVRLMADHLLDQKAKGLLIYVAPTTALLTKVRDERLIPKLRAANASAATLDQIRLHESFSGKRQGRNVSVVTTIRREIEGSREMNGNVTVKALPKAVMLITHAAFFRLPLALKNKDNVTIIFDEARKCVFEPSTLNMTKAEEDLFSQYLAEDTLPGSTEYKRVSFVQDADVLIDLKATMEKWKRKRKLASVAYGRFISMVEALELKTTEVYCMRRNSSVKGQSSFQFYEVHIPAKVFSGWRRVIIMSAYLRQTQLWAMLCRGTIGLNGEVSHMKYNKTLQKWVPVKAAASSTAYYNLKDVTVKFINDYKKRKADIDRRYRQATIVSLTGDSATMPTWRDMISSTKLNGIFVKDDKTARMYSKQFKEFCVKHTADMKKLSVKDLRRLAEAADANEERSPFAQALHEWINSVDRVASAPYMWYLRYGLKIARQWHKDNPKASGRPLFLANKNHMAMVERDHPQLVHELRFLPHSCHGRDDFKDHSMVLFQAATNPTKEARDFYESQIPWYDYNQDHIVETALQAVTRTSIRDTGSSDPVLIVVPDPYLGGLLSERLNNANIVYATERYQVPRFGIVYITKPDLTSAERVRRHRERQISKGSPHAKKISSIWAMMSQTRKRIEERPTDAAHARLKELQLQLENEKLLHNAWLEREEKSQATSK